METSLSCFESGALYAEACQLEDQLQLLKSSVAVDYLSDVKSWKYPFLAVWDVCVNQLLVSLNSKTEGQPSESSLAVSFTTSHIDSLELLLDRMFGIIQLSGCVADKVLSKCEANAERSSTVQTTMQTKQTGSAVCQTFALLLEKCIVYSTQQAQLLQEQYAVSEQQTDENEIKQRNACERCTQLGSHMIPMQTALTDTLAAIPKSFGLEPKPFERRDLLDCDLLQSHLLSVTECIGHLRVEITTLEITSGDLATQIDSVETDLRAQQNRSVDLTRDIGQETVNATDTFSSIQSYQTDLANLWISTDKLQEALLYIHANNEQITAALRDWSHSLRHAQDEVISLEQKRNDVVESHERETGQHRQSYTAACRQLEESASKMTKYDGFDKDWCVTARSFEIDANSARENWHRLQRQILEQNDDLARLQCKIMDKVLLEKTQKSENSEELSSLSQVHTTGSRKSSAVVKECASSIRQPNLHGDVDNLLEFQKEENGPIQKVNESAGDGLSMSDDIHALFAEFLEIPDVQSMPEWDLMLDTPDFGVFNKGVTVQQSPTSGDLRGSGRAHVVCKGVSGLTKTPSAKPATPTSAVLGPTSSHAHTGQYLPEPAVSRGNFTMHKVARPPQASHYSDRKPGLTQSVYATSENGPFGITPVESAWIISKPQKQGMRKK